ncbi:MAG TPA: hypothetical protein VKM55_28180 [Candidatus Lokiarchaeia archaeon]|nr:hypothetical protein [Candidatus Lokiarchaeia archaeon]
MAVIKHYVTKHPGITLDELKEAFPQKLVKGSRLIFMKPELVEDKKRYFTKSDDLFYLKDGVYALTTQSWGSTNFEKFLDYVRTNFDRAEIPDVYESNS